MIILYLLALIPAVIGAIFFATGKQVVWWEWLLGACVAFAFAGIFHACVMMGMTSDTETWSGHIINATFHPQWVERVETVVTDYDSEGKANGSHIEVSYNTHHEYWSCECTVNSEVKISKELHEDINRLFGNKIETKRVYKSGFYSGDHNIYISHNTTGYVYPTTTWKIFENRVKAAATVYQFQKVPKNAPVFEYPKNRDFVNSDRLLGTASETINLRSFDQLNTHLGPTKKVNLIVIGFGPNSASSCGQLQEAKWIGGKKNDLVICYGGGTKFKPSWCYVFGWTEKSEVKANLETLIISNNITTALLPEISNIVNKYYEIKNWHKFDYIKITPPLWSYFLYILLMIVIQTIFWIFVHKNDVVQEGSGNPGLDNLIHGIMKNFSSRKKRI